MLTIYKNLNILVDILAIIIVPALLIICSFWLMQPITIDTVVSENNFSAIAGTTSKIYSPVLINSTSRIEYELSLINSISNEVVHKYPIYYSNNITIKCVNIKIPDNIKLGIYKLVATIKYRLNPIKQGAIKVELAHITIVNNTIPN